MRRRERLAASVKQRLLDIARQRGEDFNLLLTRYGIERLLYRLSRSDYERRFVLKGAMLFHLWTMAPHRPTRDLDLLARESREPGQLVELFRTVCELNVEDDGVVFLPETVTAEPIRDAAEYAGVRLRLEGRLGPARLRLQVDIGFGDSLVPPPEYVEFPVLLDQPAPRLHAYRRETVVAEKLQAMVDLGMANSRMRDFYDLGFLAATFDFEGVDLTRAIDATFARRSTPIPVGAPTALTQAFAEDETKRTQWRAFLSRSRLDPPDLSLDRVVVELREFLLPPLGALSGGRAFRQSWRAGGPWEPPAAQGL